MVDAYNFISSWQLFPEKGSYEFGGRPKSGIYKIEFGEGKKQLRISMNWVTLEDQAFTSSYHVVPDGEEQSFDNPEIADTVRASFIDLLSFESCFSRKGRLVLHVLHEITPKGYLKITQKHHAPDGQSRSNVEIYHKQL